MALDIKATLRERGITQRAVAARLGISEPTISAWAQALRDGRHHRIPAERARDLADALSVEPSAIRPDLWPAPAQPAEAA